MRQMTVRLSEDEDRALEEVQRKEGATKTWSVRMAVADYLQRKGYKINRVELAEIRRGRK